MIETQRTSTSQATTQLFVGGLHRSGTSLVASLLAGADGATGLTGTGHMEDEGHYLHQVTPSAKDFGGPGRFAFDQRAHLVESPTVDRRQTGAALQRAWAPYWADPHARVRVEKSPQNLVQARFLQQIFPGATFVMVVRHPAAVALATRKWTGYGPPGARRFGPKRTLHSLLEHWVAAHRYLDDDLSALDRVHVVRFEDLVRNGSRELAPVLDQLGLTPGPDPLLMPRRLDPRYRRQWQGWLNSTLGTRASTTWLPTLTDDFARWGYRIDDEF